MTEETELKFIVQNYGEIARKLMNKSNFVSTAYELTVMYDNKEKSLFKEDARLRLRQIKNLKNNTETCELSYKKPKTREGIKIEEEDEVSISSFKEMQEILLKIGFFKVSSYDRVRDTFKKDNCKITLDTFSFGDILEIEGEINSIKKIAKELGLNLKNNTSKSCDDIYDDICKKQGKETDAHILHTKDSLKKAIEQRKVILN